MFRFNTIDWIAIILLVVGGIAWGLVGLFDFNLIDTIFGEATFISRLIYDLVGIASIYLIISLIARSGE